MDISIICPVYNGEKYITKLNESILKQKNAGTFNVKYILTKSKDNSESVLKDINADYRIIESSEFSHSLIREKEAFKAEGDIIVFITQDIIIEDELWLSKLTKDIKDNVCDASFSRQICTNKTIEKYTRMKNYPKESRIVSKDDISTLGIMTYFYSDAASAVRKSVFVKLNGYDNKDLLTNEDMYFSYKLINNGYKIKYCAESEVIHSHKYTYSALVKRYFDQGVFLKQHSYIYDSGAGGSAVNLLIFVIKNSIKDHNIRAFMDIVPNFGARFIGNKLGRKYEKLPTDKILKYTGNKSYWLKNQ